MGFVGLAVLLICFLAGGTLFFSVNATALRTFSHVKLQEAFKTANKKTKPEELAEQLAEKAEELILTCYLYRLILNICILLLLVAVFAGPGAAAEPVDTVVGYLLVFIAAMAIFSIFSLAIP